MYESYIKDRDSLRGALCLIFVSSSALLEVAPLEEASEHCFLNNKIFVVVSHYSMFWVSFFAYSIFGSLLAG